MFGKRKPPSGLRPKLDRNERFLAWASTVDNDGAVVVTTHGVWLPGRGRIGWHEIHKATWSGSRLTVVPSKQVDDGAQNRAEDAVVDEAEDAVVDEAEDAVVDEAEDAVVDDAQVGAQYSVMADDEPVAVNLADPGDVPAEIRERVSRSVVYTAHHALPSGGVRVVARRVPGVDGVVWHVRYDDGTDSQDPDVVTATNGLVAQASNGNSVGPVGGPS